MKKIVFAFLLTLMLGSLSVVLVPENSEVIHASVKSRYKAKFVSLKKKGIQMYIKYDFANGELEGSHGTDKASVVRKGKVYYSDLDGNGVKECIVSTEEYFHFYTQKNKKVKYLCSFRKRYTDGLANKNGSNIFTTWCYGRLGVQTTVLKMKNNRITKVMKLVNQAVADEKHSGEFKNQYYKNNKRISESKYMAYCKKYTDGNTEICNA